MSYANNRTVGKFTFPKAVFLTRISESKKYHGNFKHSQQSWKKETRIELEDFYGHNMPITIVPRPKNLR